MKSILTPRYLRYVFIIITIFLIIACFSLLYSHELKEWGLWLSGILITFFVASYYQIKHLRSKLIKPESSDLHLDNIDKIYNDSDSDYEYDEDSDYEYDEDSNYEKQTLDQLLFNENIPNQKKINKSNIIENNKYLPNEPSMTKAKFTIENEDEDIESDD